LLLCEGQNPRLVCVPCGLYMLLWLYSSSAAVCVRSNAAGSSTPDRCLSGVLEGCGVYWRTTTTVVRPVQLVLSLGAGCSKRDGEGVLFRRLVGTGSMQCWHAAWTLFALMFQTQPLMPVCMPVRPCVLCAHAAVHIVSLIHLAWLSADQGPKCACSFPTRGPGTLLVSLHAASWCFVCWYVLLSEAVAPRLCGRAVLSSGTCQLLQAS
jgi:hypothetical protein